MNLETGQIAYIDPTPLTEDESKQWLEISETMMTEKQKAEMQVSPYDAKSPLGKVFTNARARRKALSKIRK